MPSLYNFSVLFENQLISFERGSILVFLFGRIWNCFYMPGVTSYETLPEKTNRSSSESRQRQRKNQEKYHNIFL